MMFQSTPPRGGRREENKEQHEHEEVSIHAPARGATEPQGKLVTPIGVFQSTPPRGGRLGRWRSRLRRGDCFNPRPRAGGDGPLHGLPRNHVSFNPRPRAGGDRERLYHRADRRVSIHAPARGATTRRLRFETLNAMFQSTPPRGGRLPILQHRPG